MAKEIRWEVDASMHLSLLWTLTSVEGVGWVQGCATFSSCHFSLLMWWNLSICRNDGVPQVGGVGFVSLWMSQSFKEKFTLQRQMQNNADSVQHVTSQMFQDDKLWFNMFIGQKQAPTNANRHRQGYHTNPTKPDNCVCCCLWPSVSVVWTEPILLIRRIRKLRRAPETPGAPLALKDVLIFVLFLSLASGYENMNDNLF